VNKKFKIQKAGESDFRLIANTAREIWLDCYSEILSRPQINYMLKIMYSEKTMKNETELQGISYDKLVHDKELAGFCSYGPSDNSRKMKLHKIYLKKKYRSRGLGSELLRHVCAKAKEMSYDSIILNVNKNNTQAIKAYSKNGFRNTASVINDIGGGFVMDDYIFEKKIKN
jgi:ribosomal protein S18 acetylase RimI-like enzyme